MNQSISSGELLKSRLERRHHVLAGSVAWGELPGLVTLLARRGAVHFLAFGQMLLDTGRYGSQCLLSRPTVAAMTSDQLTPEQRAGAADFLIANRSWGLACRWSRSATTSRLCRGASAGKMGVDDAPTRNSL